MKLVMVGRIDECFLLSYGIDPEQASALVPAGLELITCRGAAFFNIVICRVDRMRARFTPRALGVTYWHIAYRVQVRATLADSRSMEGLYFLRSDIDRPLFGVIGNRLTDFRFHAAMVRFSNHNEAAWSLRVEPTAGDAQAFLAVRRSASDALPPASPFASLEERERVLKYAPFGLSVSSSGQCLRVAEVIRDETLWREESVEVEAAEWSYPRSIGLCDLRLVRATRVTPIDYRWRIGRTERLRSK
jgi:uncharacterized protein YqjF (DUF2071 family)